VLIGAGLLFNLLATAITLLAVLATVTTVQRLVQSRRRLSDLENIPPD